MNKDELLKYMPDYYDSVYEMEELLKAQSKGLYQFDEKINRTLLNEFIVQADEKGISVFEDQAGIKPDMSDGSVIFRPFFSICISLDFTGSGARIGTIC